MINFNEPFVVLEKLDGSLVSPLMTVVDPKGNLEKCEVEFISMNGITQMSSVIDTLVDSHESKDASPVFRYRDFCKSWILKGYSIMFEYVAPDNQIVIKYDTPMLILTAIRDTHTG